MTQAGEKSFSCKGTIERFQPLKLFKSSRQGLRWSEAASAIKQMRFWAGLLRIVTVRRAYHPQMADITPRLKEPIPVLIVENVEACVHEFKAPRSHKGN